MITLPFQASWSAAAVFCQHENEAISIWHWGHHPTCNLKITHKTPKHKTNFATHSDHLNINHQAIEQKESLALSASQVMLSIDFPYEPSILYQSPVLEQPEPPLWSV